MRTVGHPKNPDSDYCSQCKRASEDEIPIKEYAHSASTEGLFYLFQNDYSEDSD
jgi:hypothetical protein